MLSEGTVLDFDFVTVFASLLTEDRLRCTGGGGLLARRPEKPEDDSKLLQMEGVHVCPGSTGRVGQGLGIANEEIGADSVGDLAGLWWRLS
jgi:hypothetical protein